MFSVIDRYSSKNLSRMDIGIVGKSPLISPNLFIDHETRYLSNVSYDNRYAMAEGSSLVMYKETINETIERRERRFILIQP